MSRSCHRWSSTGLVLTGGGDVDPASYGATPQDVADVDPAAAAKIPEARLAAPD